ncbi:MAG: hypothetical protein RR851_10250 [Clostridium sp.]
MMNEGIKEAVQYLVGLGKDKYIKEDLFGATYTNENLRRIETPMASPIETTTLTSIVDYIKSNIDGVQSNAIIVYIESFEKVSLKSELNGDRRRETLMISNALTPRVTIDNFIDTEKFNIMLQSSFVENKDRSLLLKVTGNIQEENIKQIGDDGVSQAATVRSGIATVTDVKVPNPVILAPYRSFPEIEQVESKFIFRLQNGPKAALISADGGAWMNESMNRIKKFFMEELKDIENVKIIS